MRLTLRLLRHSVPRNDEKGVPRNDKKGVPRMTRRVCEAAAKGCFPLKIALRVLHKYIGGC